MRMNRMVALVLAAVMASANIPAALASDAQQGPGGPDGGAYAGASVSNIVYVPAKVTSCVLSGAFWIVAMTLTGGTRARQAGEFVHDVCGGQWVIKGQDMEKKKDFFLED